MDYPVQYDVIVVGCGHAGAEACLASARMGCKTLLITHNVETIGQLSCNPSIGGIGKSHLVKELDAMGGAMAQVTDEAGIQFRILNGSKGPAVRATRAQIDRDLYRVAMRKKIENQENLWVFQQGVDDLIVNGDKVEGVVTETGIRFHSKTVVLTAGTFLHGLVHVGLEHYPAGRVGDPASIRLAERLIELGLPKGRLKTGTPARIDGRSIDFSKCEEQWGDLEPTPNFSMLEPAFHHPKQVPCWITNTNEKTHEFIRNNLDRSPMFSGVIEGIGPRYCPSIEDKIVRFAEKQSHHVFLEPEGLSNNLYYPNGISSSLPFDVQLAFMHTIPGLENAHFVRPAYAIEYDCIDARQLYPSLEFKEIEGLFSAGQFNGSSGYEEAAAQGLIAGINAAQKIKGKEALVLDRSQAYIGVLIDDLVTKENKEPYRMMTSRAEYRLLLRQDNADLRLTRIGYEIGLISEERYRLLEQKEREIEKEVERMEKVYAGTSEKVQKLLEQYHSTPLHSGISLAELIRRPELSYEALKELDPERPVLIRGAAEQVNIRIKYDGYIQRQMKQVEQFQKLESKKLPETLDYDEIPSLRTEARQKLKEIRPVSVGQASRIAGVSPADISVLLVWLEQRKGRKE